MALQHCALLGARVDAAHRRSHVGMAAQRADAAGRWKPLHAFSCALLLPFQRSFAFACLCSFATFGVRAACCRAGCSLLFPSIMVLSLSNHLLSSLVCWCSASPCGCSVATPRSQETSHLLDSITSLLSLLSSLLPLLCVLEPLPTNSAVID